MSSAAKCSAPRPGRRASQNLPRKVETKAEETEDSWRAASAADMLGFVPARGLAVTSGTPGNVKQATAGIYSRLTNGVRKAPYFVTKIGPQRAGSLSWRTSQIGVLRR